MKKLLFTLPCRRPYFFLAGRKKFHSPKFFLQGGKYPWKKNQTFSLKDYPFIVDPGMKKIYQFGLLVKTFWSFPKTKKKASTCSIEVNKGLASDRIWQLNTLDHTVCKRRANGIGNISQVSKSHQSGKTVRHFNQLSAGSAFSIDPVKKAWFEIHLSKKDNWGNRIHGRREMPMNHEKLDD